MSDFARILALCQARGTTIPTIGLGVIECKLPKPIVGIVIPRARHSAKIRAKKRLSTAYLALKGCDKLKRVCARTERLSVPVIYFGYRMWFHSDLALYDQNNLHLRFLSFSVVVVSPLTGFLLWRRYWRQYWGTFFSGAFLPQKWDDLPPF
jgi:hypothetical protein